MHNYIVSIKAHFKAIHHLQSRENFTPIPHLRLYSCCRLEQLKSKWIACFQKVKVLECSG